MNIRREAKREWEIGNGDEKTQLIPNPHFPFPTPFLLL
jgi:hypothetical protein